MSRMTNRSRNERLMTAIRSAGYKNQSRFARACGIDMTTLSTLVRMKTPPITDSGEFSTAAQSIMETLGLSPLDLWSDSEMGLERFDAPDFLENHRKAMTLPDPFDDALKGEVSAIIVDRLCAICRKHGPRLRGVIEMRYGLNGGSEMTLDNVADFFGVTRERIRQNEAKALRILRSPNGLQPLENDL